MATLTQVTVKGESARGPFSGVMSFGSGLQLIAAPNYFGKSLISSAIAWCLNLEPNFSLRNGDNSLFHGGILEHVTLEEESDIVVTSLTAEIEISADSKHIFIRRSIVGGDPTFIDVSLTTPGNSTQHARLITGRGTMADEKAGFQRWLFMQLGLPLQSVLTRDGMNTNLYIENLSPLFFIEQKKGWTDLQSLQVFRYRIEEITSVAVEYLLGLDRQLQTRLQNQQTETQEIAIRLEGAAAVKKINDLLTANTWMSPQLSEKGGLEQLVRRFEGFTLPAYLEKNFNYRYPVEHDFLLRQRQSVQQKLNDCNIDEQHRAHFGELSARLLQLREVKFKRDEELSMLRGQRISQEEILRVLEARLESTKDLLRLKVHAIGVVEDVECPTCHRHINPEELEVTEQTEAEIRVHIDTLEKERRLVKSALDRLEKEIRTQLIWQHKVDDELASTQKNIAAVSGTVGAAKEAIVRLSSELTDIDQKIERNKVLKLKIESLNDEVKAWHSKAKLHLAKQTADRPDVDPQLDRFLDFLREMLAAVGHGAVRNRLPSDVHLDDSYYPCIRSRRLSRLGSASDTARLVLSYVVVLLEIGANGGHHPGFIVLDEPMQQNPDAEHREALIRLFATKWNLFKSQTIVFTNLTGREVAQLQHAEVPVRYITERRFLKPVRLLASNTP